MIPLDAKAVIFGQYLAQIRENVKRTSRPVDVASDSLFGDTSERDDSLGCWIWTGYDDGSREREPMLMTWRQWDNVRGRLFDRTEVYVRAWLVQWHGRHARLQDLALPKDRRCGMGRRWHWALKCNSIFCVAPHHLIRVPTITPF